MHSFLKELIVKAGDLCLAEQGQLTLQSLEFKTRKDLVTATLTDAVMATGFACLRAGKKNNNLVHFNRIVPQLRDIRRCGSAAIDLCYVAAGKVDGFWEMNLNVYDVAAGILMVTEAQGEVTDFTGGPDFPEKGIVAANPVLADILRSQLTS
jgi:myo-inositol-1(or 4)-monophosphatase